LIVGTVGDGEPPVGAVPHPAIRPTAAKSNTSTRAFLNTEQYMGRFRVIVLPLSSSVHHTVLETTFPVVSCAEN